MKALVKDAASVAVRQVPRPEANAGEVLIRVVLAGLCRTDVYVAEGQIPSATPLILGHEFSGVIAGVGSDANGLEPGQRVTVNPLLPCGGCRSCRCGSAADCQQTQFLGLDRHGAFAEFIAVPAAAVHLLPDSVSFGLGAYTEPVAASLAVLKAGIQPEQRGLIYGDNRISRLTQRILIAHGFQSVAVHAAGAGGGSLVDDSYDFIIETQATTETLNDVLRVIRPRGKIILKSRQHEPVALRLNQVIKKEPVFHAVNYGSFEAAIALLAGDRICLDDLMGDIHPLEEFEKVFAGSHRTEALKPFFAPAEG